jgi:hypothetical protein
MADHRLEIPRPTFCRQQDFELASMTALRYLPPPVIQQISSDQSPERPGKPFRQPSRRRGRRNQALPGPNPGQPIDDALATIAKLEKLKDCPRYIFYLKAQLCVKKQQWEQAWNALQQFGGM